jgi:hypothetical protein
MSVDSGPTLLLRVVAAARGEWDLMLSVKASCWYYDTGENTASSAYYE